LADAVVKGNAPFDANKALDACRNHRPQTQTMKGIGEYMDKGYIPDEKTGISVSSYL
jgi:hypothetical protein